MAEVKHPIAIDLFCGAGGMSLGFEQAGFDVVAAVDADPIHVTTHTRNFPLCRTLRADLSTMHGAEILEQVGLEGQHVDVVFGGPPCQGFSLMGKRKVDDPRNTLLIDFARLVDQLNPSYFVVENVEGLLIGQAHAFVEAFIERVEVAGYSVVRPIKVLDASEFGVPQRRRRAIIFGYKIGLPVPGYPDPSTELFAGGAPDVWAAISDLPNVDEHPELITTDRYAGRLEGSSEYVRRLRGEILNRGDRSRTTRANPDSIGGCLRTAHSPQTRQRFDATIPGDYEPVTRFYRLKQSGVAPTLRAGTDRTRGSFMAPRPIHPVQPRCITVREGARLHSLPDWFELHPTKWHGFRQIGNAVPPLLARAAAYSVMRVVEHRDGLRGPAGYE